MSQGKSSSLTVKWDVVGSTNGSPFGRFWLLIEDNEIGDPSDCSVDLTGCINWLREFVCNPKNRYEPDLYEMDKNLVYSRLAASVLVHEDENNFVPEMYGDIFPRFHISHIGMSSFDRVTMLLVKSITGQERCVRRTGTCDVQDSHFGVDEIEGVFAKALREMEEALKS